MFSECCKYHLRAPHLRISRSASVITYYLCTGINRGDHAGNAGCGEAEEPWGQVENNNC